MSVRQGRAKVEPSWNERGQGTLEYALVLFAFLAMLVGLSALWHAARDGVLMRTALDAASHASGDGFDLGSVQDTLLY